MRYFHVPVSHIREDRVEISGGELHHLVDVLRLREGDEITVLDGVGGIYRVVLTSCDRDAAVGEIRSVHQVERPPVQVTLLVGIPKADRMDMVVQKATELGAHRIVPVLCEHTVPHLSAERAKRRAARWRKIAVEASKQSRRPFFPVVSDILSFQESLRRFHADLKLIFVANQAAGDLKDVLRQNTGAREISIFIGPEGGLTEEETSGALSAGAIPVSLGSNILRTETAAIAALAIVMYETQTRS